MSDSPLISTIVTHICGSSLNNSCHLVSLVVLELQATLQQMIRASESSIQVSLPFPQKESH